MIGPLTHPALRAALAEREETMIRREAEEPWWAVRRAAQRFRRRGMISGKPLAGYLPAGDGELAQELEQLVRRLGDAGTMDERQLREAVRGRLWGPGRFAGEMLGNFPQGSATSRISRRCWRSSSRRSRRRRRPAARSLSKRGDDARFARSAAGS